MDMRYIRLLIDNARKNQTSTWPPQANPLASHGFDAADWRCLAKPNHDEACMAECDLLPVRSVANP